MALDTIFYRLPSSDGRHGAVADIVQGLQATCVAAGSSRAIQDLIGSSDLLLQCGPGDVLDVSFRRFVGHSCRELKTTGDGACGTHAIFGFCDSRRCAIHHSDPRGLLRGRCTRPLADIRRGVRGHCSDLVDSVVSALWSEFLVPYLGSPLLQVPHEEDIFLQRLRSTSLWAVVCSHFDRSRLLQQEFDATKARSR